MNKLLFIINLYTYIFIYVIYGKYVYNYEN